MITFRYEDAAWQEIARLFADPLPRQSKGFPEPTTRGLCCAVSALNINKRISAKMHGRMILRISQFQSLGSYAYEGLSAGPANFTKNRNARSLAALWLALDSQIDP